jgi:hypothetical protein
MRIGILLVVCCGTAMGQLSYGVIGGVPFGKLTTGTAGLVDQSGSYTIGPTVQVGLPLGFRVEADALYRGAGLQYTGTFLTVSGTLSATSQSTQKFSAAQWRFPVLVQYRLSAPVVKPFVEAGYSYDHVSIQSVAPYAITSHHGFVMGAGVDFKAPFVRVSPEIRYTRDLGAGTGQALQLNQVELLVGVRF